MASAHRHKRHQSTTAHFMPWAVTLITLALAALAGCKAETESSGSGAAGNGGWPSETRMADIQQRISFNGKDYELVKLIEPTFYFAYAVNLQSLQLCSIYMGPSGVQYTVGEYRRVGEAAGADKSTYVRLFSRHTLTDTIYADALEERGLSVRKTTCPINGSLMALSEEESVLVTGQLIAFENDPEWVLRVMNDRAKKGHLVLAKTFEGFPPGSFVFFGGSLSKDTFIANLGAYRDATKPGGELYSPRASRADEDRINQGLMTGKIEYVSKTFTQIPRSSLGQFSTRREGDNAIVLVSPSGPTTSNSTRPRTDGLNLAGKGAWETLFGGDSEQSRRLPLHTGFHTSLEVEGPNSGEQLSLAGNPVCQFFSIEKVCVAAGKAIQRWLPKKDRVGVAEQASQVRYY